MSNFKDRFESLLIKRHGLKKSDLKPEATFSKDLGVNLYNLVRLIIKLENEFGVDVSDDNLGKIHTVGDCMEVFEKLIKRKDSNKSKSHGKLQSKV